MNHVHAVGGSMEAVVEEAVLEAFRKYFAKYELVKLGVRKDPDDQSVIVVELRYRKPNSKSVEKMNTTVRVPDGTLTLSGEANY